MKNHSINLINFNHQNLNKNYLVLIRYHRSYLHEIILTFHFERVFYSLHISFQIKFNLVINQILLYF